jgi:eukaryotic-like serine/threonine-protein kinase
MRARVWISSSIATAAVLFFVFAFAQQTPGQAGKAPAKGGVEGRLTWFDRQGKVVGTLGEPGIYRTLQISPDGKRVAFERTDPATQNRDIWLVDVASGATTRFTSDPGWEAFPTWSPDGSRIVFTSNRSGVFELYVKAVNGSASEELFYQSSDGKGPNSWSPDGKYIVYYTLGQPTHLRLLSILGAERKATPLVDPQNTSITGRFSPDGRWIVYSSNESGKNEISVRAFDASTGAVANPMVVTNEGGRTPLWRGDGKEIFYVAADGTAMAMEVKTGGGFQTGNPKTLFRMPAGVLFWDVSPDGQRFLMPAPGR